MTTTNLIRTYVFRQTSRGCEEMGPSDLTYTDTVDFVAGVVRTNVRGRCDGEWVNQSSERPLNPECTPDGVYAARIKGGWTVVS